MLLLLCMKMDMLNFVMKNAHEIISNRRHLKSRQRICCVYN